MLYPSLPYKWTLQYSNARYLTHFQQFINKPKILKSGRYFKCHFYTKKLLSCNILAA